MISVDGSSDWMQNVQLCEQRVEDTDYAANSVHGLKMRA